MTYAEKLKDPRWQKKRLEVLEREKFKFESCSDDKTTLHVHHRYYVSGRLPWEYPDFCYQVLCDPCHEATRELVDVRREKGSIMFEDWEAGLNYFGENIFDLFAEESIQKSCA